MAGRPTGPTRDIHSTELAPEGKAAAASLRDFRDPGAVAEGHDRRLVYEWIRSEFHDPIWVFMPSWFDAGTPLASAMKNNRPTYAIYRPPMFGLPYLAVILAPDGTATASPFDTAEDAAAFNKLMIRAEYPAKNRN